MNDRGQMSMGEIITLFMGIIVLVVLLVAIADGSSVMTTKADVGNVSLTNVTACLVVTEAGLQLNESLAACNGTVGEAPTGWKVDRCPIESVTVRNATADLTLATDYEVFASTGIVRLLNSTTTTGWVANITYVDYTYCRDGYNPDSSSRTMAGLIVLFTALALMVWAADRAGLIDVKGMFGR